MFGYTTEYLLLRADETGFNIVASGCGEGYYYFTPSGERSHLHPTIRDAALAANALRKMFYGEHDDARS